MTITSTRSGDIAIVTIARPQARNAVNPETAVALAEAFTAFDRDDSLSVAILTGAEGHFCAGFDLKAYAGQTSPQPLRDEGRGPMGPTHMQLSKPVLAAVEGYAVAGGLELALWCDLRVASETAAFGVFCRRFGVPLIDLGTTRLPRLIGHSRAMDLILTGREVRADEALAIGLANRLVPAGQALASALALAQQLAALPQTCMRHDRLSAIEQWGLGEAAAVQNELAHGQISVTSGDTLAGMKAFAAGAGRHGGPRT